MRAQTHSSVSTKLQQVAIWARTWKDRAFSNLSHRIDHDFLREAFRRTRKDGAPGIDGMRASAYENDLEANLDSLLRRMKTGTYVAPPGRRVHIPKSPGKTRPITVPTFEDKVAQRGVAMMLEAIYEQDFKDCSYGFRPDRSQHQALQTLWDGLMALNGGWVLEVDVKGFFDNLDHAHLNRILDQRVADNGLRRLIGKWLKAGVSEAGILSYPQAGSPQGGVISPLLANVYLHEVLDRWFEEVVKPLLHGPAFLVRFADDFVIAFANERDARRVHHVIPKRLAKYGLEVSEEKTRLFSFRRPHRAARTSDVDSFTFLGLRHYWGKSRKGTWIVKRKTDRGRLSRAIKAAADWCRTNRHRPVSVQAKALGRKLRGHFAYYGVTTNARSLHLFRRQVVRIWKYWLSHRSRKALVTWDKMFRILEHHPLPPVQVVQSVYRPARL